MFYDRTDAGVRLARDLARYKGRADALVLAIPRGGVAIGRAVADALGLELDVILTKKIGHPLNPEFAIGVVNLSGEVIDEGVVARDGISRAYLDREAARIRKLLRKRYFEYRSGGPPVSLKDKLVILVDDGIATGYTMLAAIRLAREERAGRIIVAVPVAAPRVVAALRSSADEVVCLTAPKEFSAIGSFYRDFRPITDEEAIDLLRKKGDVSPLDGRVYDSFSA